MCAHEMNKRTKKTNTAATGMTYALLYTRVSGAEHQREGLSLDAQQHTTRDYAAVHGWVISGEYQDVLSGARDDRPRYQALLEHARKMHLAGQRAVVVVTRLDRLGRHLLEQVRAREELAKLGCETYSIREGGRLSDLTAHILMSVAQDERQRIGERVGETRSHVVRSGWHYGKVPFGYRKRPATPEERAAGSRPSVMEPDPVTRAVATEVFDRYATGESIYAIGRWLASLPEAQRGGRAWPAQCVWGMLQSPSYVARPAEGDGDVLARPVARWEPLVTDATFGAVQARLATSQTRPHMASNQYLLTGTLRCWRCGSRMVHASTRRGDQGGRLRGRYRCTGFYKGAAAPDPLCRVEVPGDKADDLVVEHVAEVLDLVADARHWPALKKAWAAQDRPKDDTSKQVAALDKDIKLAQKRLTDAARLLVDGVLDRQAYELLRDAEVASIAAAEGERDRLAKHQAVPVAKPVDLGEVFERAGGWASVWRDSEVAVQREIMAELVERVSVERAGYRTYSASIVWSDLGTRLAALQPAA